MKIVYMGTPDFSVGALEALIAAGHEIVMVVTQPDRPKGRNKELTVSPVKECAVQHGLPVFQPQKIKTPESVEYLKTLQADIYIVAAFGQMLSQEVLDIPRYGCVNIHASLLPQYRGAAPIQQVLLDGRKETGITIMQMDVGCDTGDILLQEKLEIADDDTAGTLFEKMSALGAELIVKTLPMIEAGTIIPLRQDNSSSSSTSKVSKEMGHIQWKMSAQGLVRLIHAMDPWPSAYTRLNGKILKIWKAEAADSLKNGEPGSISGVTADSLCVYTGKGQLRLLEVQLEGKRRMCISEFLRGNQLMPGQKFDI